MVNYIAAGLLICFLLSMGSTALQAAATGKLTLSLQTSLDGEGDVKATSITKAELISPDGITMINGNVSGGTAQFNLSGIDAGDYFISINVLQRTGRTSCCNVLSQTLEIDVLGTAKGGVDKGFIDAASLSAATPVSTTPLLTTTTEQPAATTKTPAFEALMAISALLITVLVRRK